MEESDEISAEEAGRQIEALAQKYILKRGGVRMFNGVAALIFVLLMIIGTIFSMVASVAAGSGVLFGFLEFCVFMISWIISSAWGNTRD